MNVHEYQAKELLAKFGVAIPAGYAALTVEEAVAGAKQLPGPLYVVKSQIHAGGRGKGKFKELPADAKGGVRLAFNLDDVESTPRKCWATRWSPCRPAKRQAGEPPVCHRWR
jgi:succinyl-CoA synthetase beta subunit